MELQGGAPLRLLPHQATFVDAVLSAAGKRVTLLRGGVGLGKGTTLVALANRLLQEQPTARSLFLVPAALRLQYVDSLRKSGTPALLVDRYQFREMVDSASGNEFWQAGVVSILSPEFARQVDILESLASIRWDLVVADEAHSFTGARAELLCRVGAVAERLVLATASSISLPDGLSIEDAAVVQWRRDQLVDRDGKPLDIVPKPVPHEVRFDLSQAERRLVDAVSELCRILEEGTPQQQWRAKSLLRSLRSSPAALEARLQRLAADAAWDAQFAALQAFNASEGHDNVPRVYPENPPLGSWLTQQRTSKKKDTHAAWDDAGAALDPTDVEEEAEGDGPAWSVDHHTAEKAGEFVGRALQELSAVQVDSKVVAFGGLLTQSIEAKKPATRICVLTDFLATCYYLAAEIEGHGLPCQLLQGGMGSDERLRSLTTCSATGEILVVTRAVMTEGIDLSWVTDFVLYDIPGSEVALQQVLGRVDRFGRLNQLNVHALVPLNGPDVLGFDSLGLLRKVVLSRAEP